MDEMPNFEDFDASYSLGKEVGKQIERQRMLYLLEDLPAQFSYNDHAYRAIAKMKQLIQKEDDESEK